MNVIPNELPKEVLKDQNAKDITKEKAGEQPNPAPNQPKDIIKELPKETPPPTPAQSPVPSKDAKPTAPAPVDPFFIKEQPTQNEKPPSIPMPSEVKSAKYYHGIIPRIEAESALRCVGDYLLRKAEVKEGYYVVLSVKREGGHVHIPLNQDKDAKLFWFDPTIKDGSVTEVIQLHISRGQPISVRWNVCLKKPVPRPTWIIRHEDIILYKKIGAGAFGEVFLARMVDPTSEHVLGCAVKTMKQEASIEAKLRFVKEARMMRKSYRNKHVVMIFGFATLNNPMLIIMELCPNGSLISYLRKNKGKVAPLEKLRFISEAACGLSYLEKMNCIHRDVAARNCLLSEKYEIKISDFGLADDKGMVIDYSLDKLPIKWLAPETMQEKIYSLKSDIWAFGIMVWEIFSDGDEPYPGLNNVQARAKIVVNDYRMKFPEVTPPEVVQVIETCWDKNPDKRGTMTNHWTALQAIYEARLPSPFLMVPPAGPAPAVTAGGAPATPGMVGGVLQPGAPPSETL